MQSTDHIKVALAILKSCTEYEVAPAPTIQTTVMAKEMMSNILKGNSLPTYSTLLDKALTANIFENTISWNLWQKTTVRALTKIFEQTVFLYVVMNLLSLLSILMIKTIQKMLRT